MECGLELYWKIKEERKKVNSILKFLKKIVIGTVFTTIIKGAFLGIVVGICVAFVAYGVCDLYQLPYATQVLSNPNIETIVTLYICGWGVAGIIAKLLPW